VYNRRVPTIDFNRTGEPLKHWGIINDNFIQQVSHNGATYESYLTLNPGNGNIISLLDIDVIYDASPRMSKSDVLRHMGKINFTTETLTDRDPKLVGKFSSLEEPPGGFDSLILKGYSS
jgi:hypothetical protein